MICFELYCTSTGKYWTTCWELWIFDSGRGAQAADIVCVCVCVSLYARGGGSGPTPAGGWRCGQWELSSCPVRMCPGGGGQFSFLFLFVCLSVWLHKQMGADILISTGKHSRFSLCRDMTSTGNRKSPASSLWGHSAVGVPRAWGM